MEISLGATNAVNIVTIETNILEHHKLWNSSIDAFFKLCTSGHTLPSSLCQVGTSMMLWRINTVTNRRL